jgi:hypothetical protein
LLDEVSEMARVEESRVVNVAEESPLCIAVATGKKDHSVREED